MSDMLYSELLRDLGYLKCPLCNQVVTEENMMEVEIDAPTNWKRICEECYQDLPQ